MIASLKAVLVLGAVGNVVGFRRVSNAKDDKSDDFEKAQASAPAPAPDPEWDEGWNDVAGAGFEVIGAAIGGEPGEILSSAGALVSVVVPPPAGLIIGGIMGLVGGLFGPSSPPQPSNQELFDAINNGFLEVGKQLDVIDWKLDRLDSKVNKLLEAVAQVNEHVKDLTRLVTDEAVRNRTLKYQEVHDTFRTVHGHLTNGGSSCGTSCKNILMGDFQNSLKQAEVLYRTMYVSLFAQDRVEAHLRDISRLRGNNKCAIAEAYQDIVTARFQWYWIDLMGNLYTQLPCPSSGCTYRDADPKERLRIDSEALYRDLQAYESMARTIFGLADALIGLKPNQMRQGWEVPSKLVIKGGQDLKAVTNTIQWRLTGRAKEFYLFWQKIDEPGFYGNLSKHLSFYDEPVYSGLYKCNSCAEESVQTQRAFVTIDRRRTKHGLIAPTSPGSVEYTLRKTRTSSEYENEITAFAYRRRTYPGAISENGVQPRRRGVGPVNLNVASCTAAETSEGICVRARWRRSLCWTDQMDVTY